MVVVSSRTVTVGSGVTVGVKVGSTEGVGVHVGVEESTDWDGPGDVGLTAGISVDRGTEVGEDIATGVVLCSGVRVGPRVTLVDTGGVGVSTVTQLTSAGDVGSGVAGRMTQDAVPKNIAAEMLKIYLRLIAKRLE